MPAHHRAWGSARSHLALAGEVDIAAASRLETMLGLIESGRPADLVLDLREVTFLDSYALGVLVRAHRRARAAGCTLRLRVQTGGPVARMLDLALLPCGAAPAASSG